MKFILCRYANSDMLFVLFIFLELLSSLWQVPFSPSTPSTKSRRSKHNYRNRDKPVGTSFRGLAISSRKRLDPPMLMRVVSLISRLGNALRKLYIQPSYDMWYSWAMLGYVYAGVGEMSTSFALFFVCVGLFHCTWDCFLYMAAGLCKGTQYSTYSLFYYITFSWHILYFYCFQFPKHKKPSNI